MKAKDIMPRTAATCTAEVIDTWKKAYGEISVLTINADTFKMVGATDKQPGEKVYDILYTGYMRKPTRNEMREFTSLKLDPVTYTERILDVLWLGGDDEIRIKDECFYSIMPVVQQVLDIKEAEIKKL